MNEVLIGAQVTIGVAAFGGSFFTLTHSVDSNTPLLRRLLFVAMLVAGAWYSIEPLVLGIPTSTKPGLLFAAFSAWVMLRWQSTLVAAASLH